MIRHFLKNLLFIKTKDNNDTFIKIFLFIMLIFPFLFRYRCEIFQRNNITKYYIYIYLISVES